MDKKTRNQLAKAVVNSFDFDKFEKVIRAYHGDSDVAQGFINEYVKDASSALELTVHDALEDFLRTKIKGYSYQQFFTVMVERFIDGDVVIFPEIRLPSDKTVSLFESTKRKKKSTSATVEMTTEKPTLTQTDNDSN